MRISAALMQQTATPGTGSEMTGHVPMALVRKAELTEKLTLMRSPLRLQTAPAGALFRGMSNERMRTSCAYKSTESLTQRSLLLPRAGAATTDGSLCGLWPTRHKLEEKPLGALQYFAEPGTSALHQLMISLLPLHVMLLLNSISLEAEGC